MLEAEPLWYCFGGIDGIGIFGGIGITMSIGYDAIAIKNGVYFHCDFSKITVKIDTIFFLKRDP